MLGCGYLLGAVPFGVVVARAMGVDILAVGSGNIGATNVWRTLGPKAGILVFVPDVLKGFAAGLAGTLVFRANDWGLYVGIAAILGHMFSPYLKFKGGKGVATTLGVLIAVAPLVAGASLAVFVIFVAIWRYISLGAIAAAITVAGTCLALHLSIPETVVFCLLSMLIVVKHIPNIKRLLNGTESKFSFRKQRVSDLPKPEPRASVEGTGDASFAEALTSDVAAKERPR